MGLIAFVLAFFSTAKLSFPWYIIQQVNYLANKNLPQKLNEFTTLNQVQFTSSTMHYFYTLNDSDEKIDFNKAFSRPKQDIIGISLMNKFCSTLEDVNIKNIFITYTYKDNAHFKELSINNDDCKN